MNILKFSNRTGFPCIECVGINTVGTVTTFSFNNHPYRQTNNFYGGFFVKFPNPITVADTNTVKFDTKDVSGSAVDVYDANGNILTITNLASLSSTVRLFFYDRDNNKVQLIW